MKFFAISLISIFLFSNCGSNENDSNINLRTTSCNIAFAWGNVDQEIIFLKQSSDIIGLDLYSYGIKDVRDCQQILKKCKVEHKKKPNNCVIEYKKG